MTYVEKRLAFAQNFQHSAEHKVGRQEVELEPQAEVSVVSGICNRNVHTINNDATPQTLRSKW